MYADPSIRIKRFVDAFGTNGLFLPVCAATYAPALQTIAKRIVLNPYCLNASLPGVDPLAPEVPASCTLIGAGFTVPVYPAASGTACFTLTADPTCPGSGLALHLDPNGGAVPDSDLILRCPLAASGG